MPGFLHDRRGQNRFRHEAISPLQYKVLSSLKGIVGIRFAAGSKATSKPPEFDP